MNIRRLKKTDLPEYRALCEYCFFMSREEALQYLPDDRDNKYTYGAFDGGRLASAMFFHPFHIWFNGGFRKLAGVSAVVTRPEYRRLGLVKKQMVYAQEQMVHDGFYLSALEPFKFEYYNRMGWEYGSFHLRLGFKPEDLFRQREVKRSIVEGSWDKDIPLLNTIRERILSRFYEGWIRKEKYFWLSSFLTEKPSRIYIIKDGKKETGYFITDIERQKQDKTLIVMDTVFEERVDLDAIFAFIYGHLDHYKEIELFIPPDTDFWSYFINPRIKTSLIPAHQLKVIDIAKAMSEYIVKDISIAGSLSFEVTGDETAEWNNTSYVFSIKNGRIKRLDKKEKTFASFTIQGFSQSYFGLKDIRTLIREGKASIKEEDISLFEKVFIRRNFHLADWF